MQRNIYVLRAAAAQLVIAYKKAITEYRAIMPLELSIDPAAPETFEALKANAAQGKLSVTQAYSDTAIYGRDGNITFRIFHDFGHLIYNKEFVTDAEVELAQIQWLDIKGFIPESWQRVCRIVYMADTVEQSRYEAIHGHFPVDQTAFVLRELNTQLAIGFPSSAV